MAYIIRRKDSPYLYIGNYNKQTKKIDYISTKLRKGNRDDERKAKEMVKKIKLAQQDFLIQKRFNINTKTIPQLSIGLKQYYDFKIGLKKGSKDIYDRCVNYFIECNGDLPVDNYSANHFQKFVMYLQSKNASLASQALYLRHVKALFNYFKAEGYVSEFSIPRVNPPQKKVVAIQPKDLLVIVNYFKSRSEDAGLQPYVRRAALQQYFLVKYLLLTGARISTALVQKWEDVYWDTKQIKMINVKANRKEYMFPMHKSLEALLIQMGAKQKGKLFSYSTLSGSPVFWRNTINKLYEENKISQKYTLHQLRKTFGTIVRRSGADLSTVKDLLNHSNIKVTADNYTEDMTSSIYKQTLDDIVFLDEPPTETE